MTKTEHSLQQAQRLCRQKGLRFTAARREVLQMLLQARAPCKAYALLRRLAAGHMQPPAVYRALDFLQEHGFAHKIHSQNAYIACRHPQRGHDCHFLICRRCGDAEECCSHATTELIEQMARRKKFRKPRAVVEIFADCNRCAKKH